MEHAAAIDDLVVTLEELAADAIPSLVRVLEGGGDAIDERLWRDAAFIRRLLHLLPVLVHPHQEMDVVTGQPAITGDGVGADLLEGVAEVRIAVGVIDRRCEEELGQWSYGALRPRRAPFCNVRRSVARIRRSCCRFHRARVRHGSGVRRVAHDGDGVSASHRPSPRHHSWAYLAAAPRPTRGDRSVPS